MVEVMAKVPLEERTPYVVVAFQETERMNGLTSEIRRTLKELDLGLKVAYLILLSHMFKDLDGVNRLENNGLILQKNGPNNLRIEKNRPKKTRNNGMLN